MSVSLYYSATRAEPLTGAESAEVARVVTAHMDAFPYDDEESLYLYDRTTPPDEVLAGSTKLPLEWERVEPVLDHVLASLTELRRAIPGAQWRVHVDDHDVPWDETDGYVLSE
ncbi:hypothetical protein ACGFMM_23975 [Streptomyces sp. NPDC048604]|uniref:hypothetical protein n=1 Tax=Streptomyces sp. NPDC048604 TaxID=3365578 RepID=UPI00371BEF07